MSLESSPRIDRPDKPVNHLPSALLTHIVRHKRVEIHILFRHDKLPRILCHSITLHPQLVVILEGTRAHILHETESNFSNAILEDLEDPSNILVGVGVKDQLAHLPHLS